MTGGAERASRVVVTGAGLVTPIGTGRERFWPALQSGASGVTEIARFDTSRYKVHRGCEVHDFDFEAIVGVPPPPGMGRASQLAVAATHLALADAALDGARTRDQVTVGVSVGTTCGEIQILEQADQARLSDGEDAVPWQALRHHPAAMIPAHVGHWFGLSGPNVIIPTACAAGNYSIGWAFDTIRFGRADVMVAGGTDPFSRVAFTGFARLGSVAPEWCQPFDRGRRGILVGEGAGIVVLEPLEGALARGAPILAEMLGYAISADGHHMTAPDPQGDGIGRAIGLALESAGITPDEVDYINVHGTGTPVNDKVETLAIKKVFGPHAYDLCVSATKSMIGHTMGAASAIETITSVLALHDGIVPPTMHYDTPDPECDLDCVPNAARTRSIGVALNNAIAFGGNNSCVVLRRYEG
jgi:3-oxoacyl-[acyl-carrier-protein] synthase II